ncbi:MAG TPA: hypothetical protein VGL47_46525 [Amycolatopsis sp.]|uniref:hypothetical protein n=1 Tax=Amycolatopsis sp. TaxID=37632 RepID=UPI002F3EEFC5
MVVRTPTVTAVPCGSQRSAAVVFCSSITFSTAVNRSRPKSYSPSDSPTHSPPADQAESPGQPSLQVASLPSPCRNTATPPAPRSRVTTTARRIQSVHSFGKREGRGQTPA